MGRGKPERAFHDQALEAARYRDAKEASHTPVPADDYAQATGRTFGGGSAQDAEPRRFHEDDEVWEVANSAIDAAMARGDFDNLAYAGKPIPGLGGTDDPDWWVKGLLQREQVSGLGPPALLLRKEDAEMDATLDAAGSEARVRELLADFNARIIEARRQLLGGPPVVTALRDIDAEVAAWRGRAAERREAAQAAEAAAAAAQKSADSGSAKHRGFLGRLLRGR
ncbi:hypothetical protein JOF48_000295 [Arthrobacter stackebrandtii]|uniref:DnaJ homologue subfamily C member 28 conserved domain-containing protein n=1 Tax=Arthrobacter stackebrandtii TaxID=272161 RepID=A0ABS4YRR5_9MICC|nr:DUF1992 domain-containing protein [Arthrobacter stackebrandtii]MBP2411496.1 hypothetical protein [Arthrobacter stackebrandtii]PYH00232.1 DUF1992 domain-containing protein [Arthrobacter stackebrandtii]